MTNALARKSSEHPVVARSLSVVKGIAAVIFALGVLSLAASEARAASYGVNLLVNGNAESGVAGTGGPVASIPGWRVSGSATVVKYGSSGGFPTSNDPGPSDRASAFFAGGSSPSGTLDQNIDVSANAADIDAGKVACDVAAWLGGYLSDGDNAEFDVLFFDGTGKDLLSVTLGPVTTGDRGGKTEFLNKVQTVSVPVGTRTIVASLQITRDPNNGGSYNDGYADSLSVVLRAPIVVTSTADSGAGSLRDALPRATVITFDPVVFGTANAPHVIELASALPLIKSSLTITGPGADLLTVHANAKNDLVFGISGTSSLHPVVGITALTLRGDYDDMECSQADLTIDHVTLRDAVSGGGGLEALSSTIHISNSLVTGNMGLGAGFDSCTVFLDSTTISNNSGGKGAAIFNFQGSLTATNCTISGNTNNASAELSPSIIYGDTSSFMQFSNCTVTGNSAPNNGYTFFNTNLSLLQLFSCTIAGNQTPHSAMAKDNTTIEVANTIIRDGGLTFVTSGNGNSVKSDGYNLCGDNGEGFLTAAGDRPNTTADLLKLGPLQDNGGPTFTCALLAGSIAIDKGNTKLTTDQRGLPRPVDDPGSASGGGNNSDIGAFELQLPAATPTPTGSPKATPTATPTAKPTATPTAKPTATPTAKPTATPSPPPGILNNISSRLQVGTGENVLFAGFTIQGTGSKKVFIRAAGPSLTQFGIAGALSNPQLELHNSSNLIATNDNWQTTQLGGVITADQAAAIQNSGLAPTDPAEPAIIATLPPGAYTAIVQGAGGGVGVGTVELYDLSQNNGANLTNISTRGFVQLGENVLIGGFTVANQSVNVIVETTGPSLHSFGVANALDDPQLELHDANGTIAANDDWQSTQIGGVITANQSGAIMQSGLAPSNPAESALIARLSPGSYTAIMRGANNTSGVGVIAIYVLP